MRNLKLMIVATLVVTSLAVLAAPAAISTRTRKVKWMARGVVHTVGLQRLNSSLFCVG